MIKRNCPVCGKDAYSADTKGDWVCHYCSAKIPPEKKSEYRKIDGWTKSNKSREAVYLTEKRT